MHTDSGGQLLSVLCRDLAGTGFDLVSSIPLDDLKPSLAVAIRDAARARGMTSETDLLTAVVIGNRGGRFWSLLDDDERVSIDPIDEYTQARVGSIFAAAGMGEHVQVYPGDCGFSLLHLGRACGWGDQSWLGMYIHPDFGTWFAFRAVVVTTLLLPRSTLGEAGDTCARCATRECVTACPVRAPGAPGSFHLEACVGYRLRADSPCAGRCLAREACPVGVDHTYPQSLIAHVYNRSLTSLDKWKRG